LLGRMSRVLKKLCLKMGRKSRRKSYQRSKKKLKASQIRTCFE
jgi:hypothetical protein